MQLKKILIISDIEGSSGCWSYQASSFMTKEWCRACVGMTQDVSHVVRGLFGAGVEHIRIKDFHRTGFNIIPERIDSRAKVVSGYRSGPVPGIGDPKDAEAIMFLGMHAASGTGGFLAHTLTSRIQRLEVNGMPMSELELFSASLAPFGLRPVFFSGCPVACSQARQAIKTIHVYPIDKTRGPQGFNADSWRLGLVNAAIESLGNVSTPPYLPEGPFKANIVMRNGEAAVQKLVRRWGFENDASRIIIHAEDIHELYADLIRLCYLTPLMEKMIPFALFLYNLWGRIGLGWVRRCINRDDCATING
jgi:D-aminopeptidase